MKYFKNCLATLAVGLALLGHASIVEASSTRVELEKELTALMNAGRIDEARQLLLSRPHDDADLFLFEGRLLKLQNQFTASAEVLDKALRQRPTDIVIRRELAHVLFLAQRYQQAQKHLTKLVRQDPDPSLRPQYVSMLNVINDKRRLSYRLSISLEPSTNITNGASAEFFHAPTASIRIDDNSRETSGLGLTFDLKTTFSAFHSERDNLAFDFGVKATRYSVSHANSKDVYALGVSYTVLGDLWRFQIRPYLEEELTNGQPDQTTLGLSMDWKTKVSPAGEIGAVLTTERQTKDVSPKSTGTDSSLHTSYRHNLSRNTAIQLGLLLEQNKTGLAHNQYLGQRLDFSADHVFNSGLVGHARLSFGNRNFSENFPLLSFEREDEYIELVLQFQKSSWHLFGFSPIVACKHVQNSSNISLYTYDSTSCTGTLTRGF